MLPVSIECHRKHALNVLISVNVVSGMNVYEVLISVHVVAVCLLTGNMCRMYEYLCTWFRCAY